MSKQCGRMSGRCSAMSKDCGRMSEYCRRMSGRCGAMSEDRGRMSEQCKRMSGRCSAMSEHHSRMSKSLMFSCNFNSKFYKFHDIDSTMPSTHPKKQRSTRAAPSISHLIIAFFLVTCGLNRSRHRAYLQCGAVNKM